MLTFQQLLTHLDSIKFIANKGKIGNGTFEMVRIGFVFLSTLRVASQLPRSIAENKITRTETYTGSLYDTWGVEQCYWRVRMTAVIFMRHGAAQIEILEPVFFMSRVEKSFLNKDLRKLHENYKYLKKFYPDITKKS